MCTINSAPIDNGHRLVGTTPAGVQVVDVCVRLDGNGQGELSFSCNRAIQEWQHCARRIFNRMTQELPATCGIVRCAATDATMIWGTNIPNRGVSFETTSGDAVIDVKYLRLHPLTD